MPERPDPSETPTIDGRTWFTIDGSLDPLAFEGPSFFRFPEELARKVLERFTRPGDVVLDPFCGFGTTVVVADALSRVGIGIEKDTERFEFAAARVHEPSRIIHATASDLDALSLPPVDLIFTSPPFTSFRGWDQNAFDAYWDDFASIFAGLSRVLQPSGKLVVEISNVREDGRIRPTAFEAALLLRRYFDLLGEVVRCNTGEEEAGPGYAHSYLLVFASQAERTPAFKRSTS